MNRQISMISMSDPDPEPSISENQQRFYEINALDADSSTKYFTDQNNAKKEAPKIYTATITEEAEEDENLRSLGGTATHIKGESINTLSNLRPMLTQYNTEV